MSFSQVNRAILSALCLVALVLPGIALAETVYGPAGNSSVFFPLGKSELTQEAEEFLDAWLEQLPERPSGKIIIVGLADRSGADELDTRIAAMRAFAVERAMLARGIDPTLIRVVVEEQSIVNQEMQGVSEKTMPFVSQRRADLHYVPQNLLGL